MTHWHSITPDDSLEGAVVLTRIRDEHGTRNTQLLKRVGRLWFLPDGSMYVYYTPTEWAAGRGTR